MARKRPAQPEPDYLRRIQTLVFIPLEKKCMPAAVDRLQWWETLFDVSHRRIEKFYVRRKFRLPGPLVAAPAVKIQGVGERDLKFGDRLYVRFDDRAPDFVEVEVVGDGPRPDQVFSLTRQEFDSIRWMLEPGNPLKTQRRKKVRT